jgi:hypothetical protein
MLDNRDVNGIELKVGDRVQREFGDTFTTWQTDGNRYYFSKGDFGRILSIVTDYGLQSGMLVVEMEKYPYLSVRCIPRYLKKVEKKMNKTYNLTEPVPSIKEQIRLGRYVTPAGREINVKTFYPKTTYGTKSYVVLTFGGNDWNQASLREGAEFFIQLADALERIDRQE